MISLWFCSMKSSEFSARFEAGQRLVLFLARCPSKTTAVMFLALSLSGLVTDFRLGLARLGWHWTPDCGK